MDTKLYYSTLAKPKAYDMDSSGTHDNQLYATWI